MNDGGSHSEILLELCSQLLKDGIAVRFRAVGSSMSPTIHDGEAIEVAPAAAGSLERGDIALCRGPRGLLAHRVVRAAGPAGKALRLRGDACLEDDEPILADAVLGRVVAVERGSRRLELAGPAARVRRRLERLAKRLRGSVGFRKQRGNPFGVSPGPFRP